MVRHRTQASEEVAIGVVGAEGFVHRIASVARDEAPATYRLVTTAYERESGARDAADRIVDDVDVLLFAGPLPYDLAVAERELPVPATYVPTGGVALPTALLRGSLSGTIDPTRVSIDSVLERDVREIYDDLGTEMPAVHVMEYHPSVLPDEFFEFHRALFADGRTSGAISTVPTVIARLDQAGIPNLRMPPGKLTLRNALRTARLLGSGARLQVSRIAIVIVGIPASALPQRTSASSFSYQELKLSLHRSLLPDARRMDAVVLERDEQSYMVITTLGALRTATEELSRAPFVNTVSENLNTEAEVGIGLGRTTLEAEENAYAAVTKAADAGGGLAYLISPDGASMALPAVSGGAAPEAEVPVDRQGEMLRQIVSLLDQDGDSSRVVDADRVARLQGVTLRTARRTLRNLVDAGFAWPLPPAKAQKVGRPPVRYQLLEERLTQDGVSVQPK